MKVVVTRAGALDLVTPSSRRNAILCALLFAACVAIAYPVADVPFGDDFSYTRTALDFARTGHFVYNGWATAMLGWQVLWGALFIKLFGFSFTIVRLSMLPIAMASAYLFHQTLVRFGIGARDAILGTLTLGLSPLFFMVATTYLTDVAGLFVVILCLYMCQRAIVAHSSRAAILWLVSAGTVNLIGGTVRQTSWLGVLIMAPSTAWFLRKQRGMLLTGAATALIGLAGVLACLHWANHQPFFVPELIFVDPHFISPFSVLGQYSKAFLCLLLLLAPIAAGWLPSVPRLSRASLIRIIIPLSVLAVAVSLHLRHTPLDKWLAPWLIPFLQLQALGIPAFLRIVLSILVPIIGIIVAEHIFASFTSRTLASPISPYSRAALWLVGPFALGYLTVLLPRAATTVIQDRYLLVIMPSTIVLLLILYERSIAPALPALSVAILSVFAIYTILVTHDFYADLRATHTATLELLADGVPRTAIAEGFAADLWEQVEVAGFVNSSNMVSAAGNYNPNVPPWPFPEDCISSSPRQLEPAVQPRYFIGYAWNKCFAPTKYSPVVYRAWMPPFRRTKLVQRIVIDSGKAQ